MGGIVWNHTLAFEVTDENAEVKVAVGTRTHIIRQYLNVRELGEVVIPVASLEPDVEVRPLLKPGWLSPSICVCGGGFVSFVRRKRGGSNFMTPQAARPVSCSTFGCRFAGATDLHHSPATCRSTGTILRGAAIVLCAPCSKLVVLLLVLPSPETVHLYVAGLSFRLWMSTWAA